MKRKSYLIKTDIPNVYRTPKGSRRLPNGGWVIRYRDPDERTLRQTFHTKKEATDKLEDVHSDIRRGTYKDTRKVQPRFREVAEEWFAHAETRDHKPLKPSTKRSYRLTLDAHILPVLGDKRIDRIKAGDIEDFLARLRVAPKTKLNILRVISPIFKRAVKHEFIDSSPVPLVDLPTVERQEPKTLTAEQVSKLAETVEPVYRTIVLFAAATGARAGEIAALRVRDLDLLRRRVTIARSLSQVSGQDHFLSPKNRKVRSFSNPTISGGCARGSLGRPCAWCG